MTKYAYFGHLRGHNSGTHDGIWLVQERNQDLLVIQVVCKFGSNQIKNETSIVQTRNCWLTDGRTHGRTTDIMWSQKLTMSTKCSGELKIAKEIFLIALNQTCTHLVSPIDLGSFLELARSHHVFQSYGPLKGQNRHILSCPHNSGFIFDLIWTKLAHNLYHQ